MVRVVPHDVPWRTVFAAGFDFMQCVSSNKMRLSKALWRGAAILAIVAGMAGQASASRIHHYEVPREERPSRLSFTAFLEAGPALWAVETPRIPHGLALARNPDGTLVDNLFLEFLLFRRSLDPTRFDHYHPVIGPILANYLPPLPSVSTPITPTTPEPQTTVPQPLPPHQGQTVPEPSTWLIGSLLIGGVALVRRRQAGSAD